MKPTFANEMIAVYDEVLPDGEFRELWLHIQNESYQIPNRGGNWIKVWRLNDGPSVSSKEYLHSKRPFGNPLDRVMESAVELSRKHTALVGAEGREWRDVTLRSYLYPRGTKLSWHDDTGGYSGAFSYYAHPRWGSTWGGELLVAVTKPFEHLRAQAPIGPSLDREWEDEYLLGVGLGTFISAKPNRMVLTGQGVYHSINRVDADAGDHVRASVSGFFVKP